MRLLSFMLFGLLPVIGASTTHVSAAGWVAPGAIPPGEESPEGTWAPSLAECRDPASARRATIRLKGDFGAVLTREDKQCRIARIAHTATGYRLHLLCHGSLDALRMSHGGIAEEVVVDAIGPVTMRENGRRVYRCASLPPLVLAPAAGASQPVPASGPERPRPQFTEPEAMSSSPQSAPVPTSASPASPPVTNPAKVVGTTPQVRRGMLVDYTSSEAPGTVVVETRTRLLYLVQEGGKALRYRVAVGREGAAWKGIERVTRKREWPDWTPTPNMRRRNPRLPLHVAGGRRNPLGARALYLGSSAYRIHGTTDPGSIGRAASSGCIRMLNDDVIELYDRVPVGTRVVVL